MNKEVATAEESVSIAKAEIIKESQRIEESSLYSSKGHFIVAYFWSNFHLVIGIPMVILAAIAGSSFISNDNTTGGILSIIVAILSAIMTFLNPNEKAHNHLNVGNNFDSLLNDIRIFRTIDCWQEDLDRILTERLKSFSSRKSNLNGGAPQIPWWAYQLAKRGIMSGEGDYKVDKKLPDITDQIPKSEDKPV